MQAKGLLSDYQPKYNSARAVYRERKKYIDEIDWNVLAVPPSGSYKVMSFLLRVITVQITCFTFCHQIHCICFVQYCIFVWQITENYKQNVLSSFHLCCVFLFSKLPCLHKCIESTLTYKDELHCFSIFLTRYNKKISTDPILYVTGWNVIYYCAPTGRTAMVGMEEVSSIRKVRSMTNWHFIQYDIALALFHLCRLRRQFGGNAFHSCYSATYKKRPIRPYSCIFEWEFYHTIELVSIGNNGVKFGG